MYRISLFLLFIFAGTISARGYQTPGSLAKAIGHFFKTTYENEIPTRLKKGAGISKTLFKKMLQNEIADNQKNEKMFSKENIKKCNRILKNINKIQFKLCFNYRIVKDQKYTENQLPKLFIHSINKYLIDGYPVIGSYQEKFTFHYNGKNILRKFLIEIYSQLGIKGNHNGLLKLLDEIESKNVFDISEDSLIFLANVLKARSRLIAINLHFNKYNSHPITKNIKNYNIRIPVILFGSKWFLLNSPENCFHLPQTTDDSENAFQSYLLKVSFDPWNISSIQFQTHYEHIRFRLIDGFLRKSNKLIERHWNIMWSNFMPEFTKQYFEFIQKPYSYKISLFGEYKNKYTGNARSLLYDIYTFRKKNNDPNIIRMKGYRCIGAPRHYVNLCYRYNAQNKEIPALSPGKIPSGRVHIDGIVEDERLIDYIKLKLNNSLAENYGLFGSLGYINNKKSKNVVLKLLKKESSCPMNVQSLSSILNKHSTELKKIIKKYINGWDVTYSKKMAWMRIYLKLFYTFNSFNLDPLYFNGYYRSYSPRYPLSLDFYRHHQILHYYYRLRTVNKNILLSNIENNKSVSFFLTILTALYDSSEISEIKKYVSSKISQKNTIIVKWLAESSNEKDFNLIEKNGYFSSEFCPIWLVKPLLSHGIQHYSKNDFVKVLNKLLSEIYFRSTEEMQIITDFMANNGYIKMLRSHIKKTIKNIYSNNRKMFILLSPRYGIKYDIGILKELMKKAIHEKSEDAPELLSTYYKLDRTNCLKYIDKQLVFIDQQQFRYKKTACNILLKEQDKRGFKLLINHYYKQFTVDMDLLKYLEEKISCLKVLYNYNYNDNYKYYRFWRFVRSSSIGAFRIFGQIALAENNPVSHINSLIKGSLYHIDSISSYFAKKLNKILVSPWLTARLREYIHKRILDSLNKYNYIKPLPVFNILLNSVEKNRLKPDKNILILLAKHLKVYSSFKTIDRAFTFNAEVDQRIRKVLKKYTEKDFEYNQEKWINFLEILYKPIK